MIELEPVLCARPCNGTTFEILTPRGVKYPVHIRCVTCNRRFKLLTKLKVKKLPLHNSDEVKTK